MYLEATDRLIDGNVISINGIMRSQSLLMVLKLNSNYEFCPECGNCAVVNRSDRGRAATTDFRLHYFEILKLSLCMLEGL